MAGYSSTPLPRKLGIAQGDRVVFLDPPSGFRAALGALPERVTVRRILRGGFDVILLFARDQARLRDRLPAAASSLREAGGLWVAWPKKSSGLGTDLSFDVVQRAGLDLGLVDNKVCAVDDTWSGLRFVVRREDRRGARRK